MASEELFSVQYILSKKWLPELGEYTKNLEYVLKYRVLGPNPALRISAFKFC